MPASRAAMSFAGAIGIGKESEPGAIAARNLWLIADSDSFTTARTESPNSPVAYGWNIVESVPGQLTVSGGIALKAYGVAAFSELLSAALDRAALAGGTPVPGQPNTYSIEVVKDNGKSLLYTGCMVDSASFDVKPSELVGANFSFKGMVPTIIDSSTPSPSVGALFHGRTAAVTLTTGTATLANEFSLSVANKVNPRFSFTGTDTARVVRAGRQEIKGSIGLDFEDTTVAAAFLAKGSEAITVTVTASDGSTLAFDIPDARFEGHSAPNNAEAPIVEKLPFIAVMDPGKGYAVGIVLSIGGDVVAPTVTCVPIDTATNVNVTANVVWTASENLAAGTVTTENAYVIKTDDGTNVAGAVTLSNAGASTTITFNPTASLAAGTAYTAVLSTAVTDAAHNHLAAPSIINFTTAA